MPGDREATGRLAVDILVKAEGWPPESDLAGLVSRAVEATIRAAGLPAGAGSTELSVVFADDAEVRELNRVYRHRDEPTNVLSFPAPAGAAGALLGDIVLARETLEREAAAGRLKLADHLTHLIVHGILHLFGYDHEADDEAAVMERLETAILGSLGIADPYLADEN